MPVKRRALAPFALTAVLAALGLFVLEDTAAGIASLAAMVSFIVACTLALRRYDSETVKQSERAGYGGWFGGF